MFWAPWLSSRSWRCWCRRSTSSAVCCELDGAVVELGSADVEPIQIAGAVLLVVIAAVAVTWTVYEVRGELRRRRWRRAREQREAGQG